jgi:hypothetical protein
MTGRGVFRTVILRSKATKDLMRSFSPSGFRMSPQEKIIKKLPEGSDR